MRLRQGMLGLLALVVSARCVPAQTTTGTNGYYDVAVDAEGEYTAATGSLHPIPGLNVFYGGLIPLPGTSWNTVRSYDSSREWVLRTDPSGGSPGFTCAPIGAAAVVPILDGTGATTGVRNTWRIDDAADQLTITQEVAAEGTTYANSVVRVTLCVRNDALVPASIGIRYLWDWQISGLDGPFLGMRPPHPPTEPLLSREQDFPNPSFDFYDISNTQNPSIDPPFYRIGGTVTGPPQSMGPTPPELVQYVSWPAARNRCFEYATTGAIVGATGGTDSAVTYSWGATRATSILIAPGEAWCASQYVFALIEEPVPQCAVVAEAFGGVNCGAATAVIDAATSSVIDCAGTLEYRFLDPAGRIFQDWSSVAQVAADQPGDWWVEARCSTDVSCADSERIEVILERLPQLGSGTAVDVAPCNLGVHVEWDAATWQDGAGGFYDLHRSEISCADALAQPPLVSNASSRSLDDAGTRDGMGFFYVVVAENATPARVCGPVGPRGGAFTTLCIGPVTERADPTPPPHVCWPLRVSHSGDSVKLAWSAGRALLPDEHVHVRKALGQAAAGFVLVSPEGFLGSTWSETDTSSRLQFFDVRYANQCEIESADDEPPGKDPPPGVPCP